eukprot:EG_transcript_4274
MAARPADPLAGWRRLLGLGAGWLAGAALLSAAAPATLWRRPAAPLATASLASPSTSARTTVLRVKPLPHLRPTLLPRTAASRSSDASTPPEPPPAAAWRLLSLAAVLGGGVLFSALRRYGRRRRIHSLGSALAMLTTTGVWPTVPVPEAFQLWTSGEYTLVDLRSDAERRQTAVVRGPDRGAVHLPMFEAVPAYDHTSQQKHLLLQPNPEWLADVRHCFPRTARLIVMCSDGGQRTAQALRLLSAAGFTAVLALDGGFNAWDAHFDHRLGPRPPAQRHAKAARQRSDPVRWPEWRPEGTEIPVPLMEAASVPLANHMQTEHFGASGPPGHKVEAGRDEDLQQTPAEASALAARAKVAESRVERLEQQLAALAGMREAEVTALQAQATTADLELQTLQLQLARVTAERDEQLEMYRAEVGRRVAEGLAAKGEADALQLQLRRLQEEQAMVVRQYRVQAQRKAAEAVEVGAAMERLRVELTQALRDRDEALTALRAELNAVRAEAEALQAKLALAAQRNAELQREAEPLRETADVAELRAEVAHLRAELQDAVVAKARETVRAAAQVPRHDVAKTQLVGAEETEVAAIPVLPAGEKTAVPEQPAMSSREESKLSVGTGTDCAAAADAEDLEQLQVKVAVRDDQLQMLREQVDWYEARKDDRSAADAEIQKMMAEIIQEQEEELEQYRRQVQAMEERTFAVDHM